MVKKSTFEYFKNGHERCHFMSGSLAVSIKSWMRPVRFTSVLLLYEPTFSLLFVFKERTNMTASKSTQIRILKKGVGEEGKISGANRPTDKTSHTKHAYGNICIFSTLRSRPTFVLVFPSNKSYVLSSNLLVHRHFWYPWQWLTDNDPIELQIDLSRFLGSCTYWALCIEPTQADFCRRNQPKHQLVFQL